ncbi:hypothetical protein M404DRAFT_24534 [Pisolithus tinctorius Marx 270]|uniref:Uncharacterized protein n=1 Tax=Pisolithus tinctorius Marx 270 TaxID=870435 RepID=A0A0C3K9H7_PISTI|nr:hypothetical protein M404DRAFT_24534 [Pisolithus tinctorius Marx 270]
MATPTPSPSFKPSPPPASKAQPALPIDEPQVELEAVSATATSLLNEPRDVEMPGQCDIPAVTETPQVAILHEQPLASFIKHLQVLEARDKDKEFKLSQIQQVLELLERHVGWQIMATQER